MNRSYEVVADFSQPTYAIANNLNLSYVCGHCLKYHNWVGEAMGLLKLS
jgi:hypothetical protein